jgi:hypothetical protein
MLHEKLQKLKGPTLFGATQAAVIISVCLFLPVPERYSGSAEIERGVSWLGIGLVWVCTTIVIGALHYLLDSRDRS